MISKVVRADRDDVSGERKYRGSSLNEVGLWLWMEKGCVGVAPKESAGHGSRRQRSSVTALDCIGKLCDVRVLFTKVKELNNSS